MLFRNKIHSINKKLTHLKKGDQYCLGVDAESHVVRLQELGFSYRFVVGESVLASAKYGTATERNANGYNIVHRDQKKETAFRQAEWHWKQFKGPYETEDHWKIVDVPYQRYPRTSVPPYSIELVVRETGKNEIIIVSGPFSLSDADEERAKNTVNMFVELFGECIVLRPDLTMWKKVPVKKLNWELLPAGKNPWDSAKKKLNSLVSRLDKGKQPVITKRFEAIGEHEPEYIAIGLGGFNSYVAFGFPSAGFCILESESINNATYVLDEGSWETISALTKAEILDAKLHRLRLIHRESWFRDLHLLLGSKKVS
jgi:hypothetical protein